MTHAGCLDGFGNGDELFLVGSSVFASDKHLDGEFSLCQGLQVFG